VSDLNFNENLATIRRLFRAREMQLIAGSAMGRVIDPATFAQQVREDVSASAGVFLMMVEEMTKEGINANYVPTKLKKMSDELVGVMLIQLQKWARLDRREMMGSNGLPSICSLQRLRLIEPDSGEIAWGWFCYRNHFSVYEFALRHPERMPETETRDTYQLAGELVWLIDASPSPENDPMVLDCAYRIVKRTGWRRCLVTVDDHRVKVAEIPIADLLQGRYEHTMDGVVLAGVNAPDIWER
jgi:hypothetical protein